MKTLSLLYVFIPKGVGYAEILEQRSLSQALILELIVSCKPELSIFL